MAACCAFLLRCQNSYMALHGFKLRGAVRVILIRSIVHVRALIHDSLGVVVAVSASVVPPYIRMAHLNVCRRGSMYQLCSAATISAGRDIYLRELGSIRMV